MYRSQRGNAILFAVLCDGCREIREVISHSEDFASPPTIGTPLLETVDPCGRESLERFLSALSEQGAVLDWPVRAKNGDTPVYWQFSGARFADGQCAIIISQAPDDEALLGDLMAMNSELLDAQRELIRHKYELGAALAQRESTREQLAVQRARLGSLVARMERSAQEERRLISVQLHDAVLQPLASAIMRLESIDTAVLESGDASSHQAIMQLLTDALALSRQLTNDLSSSLVYELGIRPALEQLAYQFHKQQGLTVSLSFGEGLNAIDSSDAAMLLEFARELLTNVVKHADTDTAALSISNEDGLLELTVSDSGCGVPDAHRAPDGYGLVVIDEAVASRGGSLTVRTGTAEGYSVTITLPAGPVQMSIDGTVAEAEKTDTGDPDY